MIATISPAKLAGTIQAPASKSDAHRALVAAALSDGPTRISGVALSEDIEATLGCLSALGARFDGDIMHPPSHLPKSALMYCAESGTTLRFLMPVVGALGVECRFIGKGRLLSRPVAPLVEAMKNNGASFDGNKAPLTVRGRLRSGEYAIPGNISSQFISGLLFALPLMDSGGSIRLLSPLESSGYADMTVDVLEQFDITIMKRANGFMIPGSQHYRSPGHIHLEGDWSNAAPMLVAGALGGGVTISGLSEKSLQPDKSIVALLRLFGANVSVQQSRVRALGGASLHGATVDVSECPDLLPVLAILGAAAEGTTQLTNASRLRLKESDRLEAVTEMLTALGADVTLSDDIIIIHGGKPLHGGEINSYRDHRVVMAAAIAATIADGDVVISDSEAVAKSYPSFFTDFKALGGKCHVVSAG